MTDDADAPDDPGADGHDATGEEPAVDPEMAERIRADPFCAFLGVDLVALDAGTATAELTVREEHLNFHGTPHGGVVYSLADAAFGAAANAAGRTALALETNLSHYDAVEVGETLTARAEQVDAGGRTAGYRVAVTDGAGDPVASFRGRVYLPG